MSIQRTSMYLDCHNNCPTIGSVSGLIRQMRWEDLESLATRIEAARRAGRDRSERTVTAAAVFDAASLEAAP